MALKTDMSVIYLWPMYYKTFGSDQSLVLNNWGPFTSLPKTWTRSQIKSTKQHMAVQGMGEFFSALKLSIAVSWFQQQRTERSLNKKKHPLSALDCLWMWRWHCTNSLPTLCVKTLLFCVCLLVGVCARRPQVLVIIYENFGRGN